MNKLEYSDVRKIPTPEEIQEALATMEVAPEGVSQKLADAALTITALSAFYGQYNEAKGFNKAVKDPRKRAQIQGRMANNVDQVGATMHKNATGGYIEREAALFSPLVQAEALREAGYDPGDLEDAEQVCLISLRRRIGVGVNMDTRTEYVRTLRKTARI